MDGGMETGEQRTLTYRQTDKEANITNMYDEQRNTATSVCVIR